MSPRPSRRIVAGSLSVLLVAGLLAGGALSARGALSASAAPVAVTDSPNSPLPRIGVPPVNGVKGVTYFHYLDVRGFPAPSVEVASGALPPGLTLQVNYISGVPTEVGTFIYELRAFNGNGSHYVSASTVIEEPVAPSAPTNLVATPGDRSAEVTFQAPSSLGNARPLEYTVTAAPNGATCTTRSTSCVVSGLQNGTTYTFTAVAITPAGTSPVSEASAAVTPLALPGPPRDVRASSADRWIEWSWDDPLDLGGAPIDRYEYRLSSPPYSDYFGPFDNGVSRAASAEVANGVIVSIEVRAHTLVGYSAWSEAVLITASTTPDAPTQLEGAASDGQVSWSWAPPRESGGAEVTGYSVRLSNDGGSTWSAPSDVGETEMVASGLTNGEPLTAQVAARNLRGLGTWSAPVTVVPGTVPGAPTLAVQSTAGQINLSWSEPSDGGYPITAYETRYRAVSETDWIVEPTGSHASHSIETLVDGVPHDVQVRAINGLGAGAWSDSLTATPFTLDLDFRTSDGSLAGRSIEAGTPVTITGSGLPSGADILVELHSEPTALTSTLVEENGTLSITTTIPGETPFGPHELVVIISADDVVAATDTVAFTVRAAHPSASSALPRTGHDAFPAAAIGIVLLVGGGLAWAARRRDVRDAESD